MRALLAVDNPLREGLQAELVAEPCVVVIFGATGDLTHRKLMPALYNLALDRLLPAGSSLVGFARRPFTDESFRGDMLDAAREFSRQQPYRPAIGDRYGEGIRYIQASFDDPDGYEELKQVCAELDATRGTRGNRLFYLATPPSFYEAIIENLGNCGIAFRQDIYSDPMTSWNRIVVEKPFGHDLPSAHALNAAIASVFSERQIYRIDHYLGKETVQNVLAFRFANILFEPVWNRQYVDHVQITAAESIGVEGRGGYYDDAGALRDMVQSHLLQLLTVVAMEPPAFFNGNAVRDEKVKVLRSVVPPLGDEVATHVVRGQYEAGFVGGRPVPGYREERGVAPDSRTETFVALRLGIDNWRWDGVPFYLRTGKALPRRVTEIAVEFKRVPHLMFQSVGQFDLTPNVISLRIQPDEGIAIRFAAKVPGARTQLRTVRMDFLYGESFGEAGPDAYERLLLDAMLGDPTLFTRRDEVEAAWAFITPILEGWANEQPARIPTYPAGSWGPPEADEFIGDGRAWRRL